MKCKKYLTGICVLLAIGLFVNGPLHVLAADYSTESVSESESELLSPEQETESESEMETGKETKIETDTGTETAGDVSTEAETIDADTDILSSSDEADEDTEGTGSISITKYITKKESEGNSNNTYMPVEGAIYNFIHLKDASKKFKFKTDKEGNLLEKIDVGRYLVTEENTISEVKADSFVVNVRTDQTRYIRIVDGEVTSNHIIKVIDAETKKPILNTKIAFYTKDNKQISFVDFESGKELKTVESSAAGVHLPEVKTQKEEEYAVGDELYYKVVGAPEGYVYDDTIRKIDTPKSSVEEQSVVDIPLAEKTGSIAIEALNEDSTPLANVELTLFAKNDITSGDGTVRYKKDKIVTFAVTNNAGVLTFSELHYGEYYVMITGNAGNVVSNTNKYDIKVSDDLQELRITSKQNVVTLKVENTVNDNGVSGIIFQLWKENESPKDYQTDEEGMITFRGLTPGKWYLKQHNTVEGTLLPASTYEFSVDETGRIQGNDNYEISVGLTSDAEETYSVLAVVKDREDNSYLPGSEFTIYDSNNNMVGSGTVKEKRLNLGSFPAGHYKVVQTKAVEGYVRSQEEKTIEVKDKRVSVAYFNDRVHGYVEITKLTSDTKTPMANVSYEVLDQEKKVIEEIKTDMEGIAVTKKMPIGVYKNGKMEPLTYYIKEKETVEGYKKDDKEYDIKFDYLDDTNPLVYISLSIPGFSTDKNKAETQNAETQTTETSAVSKTEGVMNPKTGLQSYTLWYLMGGVICIVAAGSVLVMKKRKRS